jgi:hypothetical protein
VPNIRELNAPSDLGLRPDDRASDSLASSGRRIAGLYGQAGEAITDTGRRLAGGVMDVGQVAQKYMEHQEVSHKAAVAATTLSDLDSEWNKTVAKADPNDPTVAAKFREEVLEPRLAQLSEGPITEGGQKFAEAQVESFRNHFVTKTSADMARLAGVAAKSNIETLTNQLSNAAINDPTSLKTSLGMVEHSIGAMVDSSPNLRGVDGAAMKLELTQSSQKEIVKAAAIGAISANPEAGLKQFSSPEYSKYISGAELRQLEQRAKEVQRAVRADENYQRLNKQRTEEDASDQREGQYLTKLHSDDPKEAASVSAKAIANDFTLTRAARERMIGIVERETKPEAAAKVSNTTATDLISRIRAPAGDPTRIDDLGPVYDAYEKGRLSKADLKFVRDEFVNLRTPEGAALGVQQEEFIKSVKPLIDKSNPLLGKIDQSGPQQVYNFTMDLRRKVDEYRKAGKDPRDLMDPSKPDYLGSPAALQGYQKPLQQSLQDTARALRGAPKRDDVMPAIPPPDQRPPGLYETPKGAMRWTGTGWVKP